MANHLFDALTGQAHASRPFIETEDGGIIRYEDMLERTARLANALVRLGVTPGDRVAAQVEKSADTIMLYLACLRAGAVYLPLNTAYTAAEVGYFIDDAEPRLFIVDPVRTDRVAGIAAKAGAALVALNDEDGGSLVGLAAKESASFNNAERGADDLAALLYTSGTTGRSKGAMLSHDNLSSNARALVEAWRFSRDDVLIHALPLFHTHGLFVATNVVLTAGASMLLQSRFDPDRIASSFPRATVLMGVPTFYVRLLQHPGVNRESTQGMRLFVSGSAPLLSQTHEAWRERTGHAILERYGMTETNMIASNPYSGERRPGTVGFPLPGVEVRIADPDSARPVDQDQIGMIEVRGPNVFKGYWRMPEKTAKEFREDGFFMTGDLGTIDPDGYVQIVGRNKDLIISGGYNIYPKEIEQEIDRLEGVTESAVIGLPHPDMGEGVAAVVVRRPGASIDGAAILGTIASRLARFKHPRHVVFIDELPRNTMGKVQKNMLRERYARLFLQEA